MQTGGLMVLLLGVFALTGCASTKTTTALSDDPYQSFNRPVYAFNTIMDKAVFKPVASAYHAVLPDRVAEHITYFFANLGEPATILNDVLQGRARQAGSDTGRFLVNSTVGVGGLFDVASRVGFHKNTQDFGLTLAKWGYTSSNYLVLPIVGPSTVRDALGEPVNYFSSVYPYIDNDTVSYSLMGAQTINTRANLLRYDDVLKQAFDPYVFVRNAYMQNRAAKIKKNADADK